MKNRWRVMLASIGLAILLAIAAGSMAVVHVMRDLQAVRTSPPSTDLDALTREIHVPHGAQSAVWYWRTEPKGGLVPSPSTHFVIARVVLTPDAMGELLAQGEWVVAALPTAEFGDLSPTTSVLMNTSKRPKHSVIDGTAWMNVTLYADMDANALYISALKD